MTNCLVTLNAGSSSIKFGLFALVDERPDRIAGGQVEGLGAEPSFSVKSKDGHVLVERGFTAGDGPVDHRAALALVLEWLDEAHPELRIAGVGHRIVHGGLEFVRPVLVDDAIIAKLERLSPLAPLHQPHNIAGIEAARLAFPGAPQVACFDTAFHRSQPFVNDVFGLPRRFYDEGVRRYGFHGLSYESIIGQIRLIAPAEAMGRVIVAHLGNGSSMCATLDGRSIASTMGFTALDGLPMGTRCGQLDPGVLLYLMQAKGMGADEITDLLYKQSGLKGLSGVSHDMRALEQADTPDARDAIDYFVFRIRRELGALAAVLGGLDALVFTGGIGENAWRIRAGVLSGMEWLGIVLDSAANSRSRQTISAASSRVRVLVLRTDEEEMIASHTMATARICARAPALA